MVVTQAGGSTVATCLCWIAIGPSRVSCNAVLNEPLVHVNVCVPADLKLFGLF